MRRDRQGPPKWEFPPVEQADVLLPRVHVLQMDAVDVAERRDAGAEHVGPVPETVAVDEFAARLVFDEGVGTGYLVASGDERVVGVIHPGPLGRPVGDRSRGWLVLADDA